MDVEPLADELRVLEDKFPGWQVWVVGTWDGTRRGQRWCARRVVGGVMTRKEADTAGHLAEYLSEWPDA